MVGSITEHRVEMIETFLNSIFSLTGDWTTTIILGTLSTRTLLITPLQTSIRFRHSRYRKIKPLIDSWDSSLCDKREIQNAKKSLYKNHNCSPLGTLGRSALQFPVFLGISWSIKNIIDCNNHSTPFLWIDNLSLVDPSLILPITLGGIHLLNLQNYNYFDSTKQPSKFRILGNIVAFSMIPLSSYVPTGILLYWITSALHALVSNIISSILIR